AGLLVGAIALVFPQVLGVGYEVTDRALRGDFGFWLLIGIIVAKIVASGLSIGGGFGGGVFSPSLMLGAMVGAAFGALAGSVFPDIASDRGAYTLVGMGAVAGAVLGAPISTILIIFELTGDYKVTLGVMVAVVIASAITQVVFGRSFFHWQLSSRGIMAHLDYAERQIQRTTMASLALPTAPVMHHSCTIADAQTMLLAAPSRIIYVVDDKGELRGAVGLGDLFAFGSDAVREAHEAVEHVMRKPPFLLAEDNIEDAIQLFSRSSEVILPVVKDRSQRILVGEVRQRDVMVAYHDAHEAAREA
ncbi:MAG: chloride channel protein, partial [Rhodospirillaceae bacterium]|nr:chloride channel protein [Rhodospirillaceae bacterium]